MKFREFGEGNPDVVVLVHEGGLKSWEWDQQVEELQNQYHVVVPIVEHADAAGACKQEADSIADYLKNRYNGRVYAICGLSNSWPITRNLLQNQQIHAKKTFQETRDTIPGEFVVSMMRNA